MDRGLAARIGSFVVLVAASCGSDHPGSNANGEGSGAASGSSSSGSSASGSSSAGDDASSGAPAGDAATSGSDAGMSTTTSEADVLQIHKHINRDGLFVDPAFTESAFMGKTLKLDTTFDGTASASATSPDHIYASPLYVTNGVNGKGTFYVATESNDLYALDETTGKSVIAAKSAGAPATVSFSPCGCGNIKPIGITGTPAIDPTTRLIVFDAATGNGTAANGIKTHTIHAWSIDDFHEVWSLDVSKITDSAIGAFVPGVENQRSAVLIVNGVAYVTYGGHWGDCGMHAAADTMCTGPQTTFYHGWIVAIPLDATPATVLGATKHWVTPSTEAGMWAAGGPASDGTDVFATTGNGDNGSGAAGWKGAFSVVHFTTAGGFGFTQSSTSYFHAVDDNGDEDLGGSGPLVIDDPNVTPPHMIVQLGKDNDAYVLNRANLGGESDPPQKARVNMGELSNVGADAVTPDGTFVAFVSNTENGVALNCGNGVQDGNLEAITLAADGAISVPWCVNAQGGGSPSITSSDGTKDFMVWSMGTDIANSGGDGDQLHAWDLEKGTAIVTGSDTIPKTRHFTTPIFVHGRAFVVGDGKLYALKLP